MNRTKFADENGLDMVTAVFNDYANDISVMAPACGLLRNLTVNGEAGLFWLSEGDFSFHGLLS